MKTFSIGQMSAKSDPWDIGPRIKGPHIVIDADSYFIAEGFVTFVRNGENFVSVPVSRVGTVGEVLADHTNPLRTLDLAD